MCNNARFVRDSLPWFACMAAIFRAWQQFSGAIWHTGTLVEGVCGPTPNTTKHGLLLEGVQSIKVRNSCVAEPSWSVWMLWTLVTSWASSPVTWPSSPVTSQCCCQSCCGRSHCCCRVRRNHCRFQMQWGNSSANSSPTHTRMQAPSTTTTTISFTLSRQSVRPSRLLAFCLLTFTTCLRAGGEQVYNGSTTSWGHLGALTP